MDLDTADRARAAYEEAGYACNTLNDGRDHDYVSFISEEHNKWCVFLAPMRITAMENPHVTVLMIKDADCAGVTLLCRVGI